MEALTLSLLNGLYEDGQNEHADALLGWLLGQIERRTGCHEASQFSPQVFILKFRRSPWPEDRAVIWVDQNATLQEVIQACEQEYYYAFSQAA